MNHSDDVKMAEARRLAWRCRRGLLELDLVLQRFVALEFTNLSRQELIALDALLALPDNDFWDLLVIDQAIISDAHTKNIILKIKSMHQA